MKTTAQVTILFAFLLRLLSAGGPLPVDCTVTVNGKNVDSVTGLAHIEDINKINALSYIEGSHTYDTLRYGNPTSFAPWSFPLKTSFTDRYKNEWEVALNNENSQVTMCFPGESDLYWHGIDGEGPFDDRTRFDAQTEWIQVTLSYQEESDWPWIPNPHGIRVEATAYRFNDINENKIDDWRWAYVLDQVTQGVYILKALADIAATMGAAAEVAAA